MYIWRKKTVNRGSDEIGIILQKHFRTHQPNSGDCLKRQLWRSKQRVYHNLGSYGFLEARCASKEI